MIAAVIASFASLPERTRIIFALAVATLVGSLVFYMHTRFGHGDIQLYHRYALEFWAGSHFLRALPAEYPLLSLIPFSLTVLPPLPDYVSVFALWMLALMAVGLLAMARQESARAAEVCGVYLTLGGLATVSARCPVRVRACDGGGGGADLGVEGGRPSGQPERQAPQETPARPCQALHRPAGERL